MIPIEKLAPYLPYGLKVKYIFTEKVEYHKLVKCDTINVDIISIGTFLQNINTYQPIINVSLNNIKPILHPLSDLTKDEYSFIYEYEMGYDSLEDFLKLDNESRLKYKFSYEFLTELFHYHFDFFGLIPEGLATDINTLS